MRSWTPITCLFKHCLVLLCLVLSGAFHPHCPLSWPPPPPAPPPPKGTGKTETVKELSRSIGKLCVVFNMTETLDSNHMRRLLMGIATAGAWACFDEFNRMDMQAGVHSRGGVGWVEAWGGCELGGWGAQVLAAAIRQGVDASLSPSLPLFSMRPTPTNGERYCQADPHQLLDMPPNLFSPSPPHPLRSRCCLSNC